MPVLSKKVNATHSRVHGFALVEIFLALAIFVTVLAAVYAFELNLFSNSQVVSGSLETVQNAQIILKNMLTELRSTTLGANGAYPIVTAGTSTLVFFSSPIATTTVEEISYTLKGTTLYRSVILPSGSPITYNPALQSTTTLISGVYNSSSTPVFQYYNENYTGTSSPLVQPVTPSAITLVKVSLILDANPALLPAPRVYTIQASLRNLKTNL